MVDLLSRSKVASAVLDGVDQAVENRWEAAQRRAADTRGTTEERVAQSRRAFAREIAAAGAGAGALAVAPGVGTGAALGAAVVEVGWVTARMADLILTIAAIHGHDAPDAEERRAWILAILAFGDDALDVFTKRSGERARGLGQRITQQLPGRSLRVLNRSLRRRVVSTYGKRRGLVALGELLPLGMGAAIGGRANWALAQTVARQANSFFTDLGSASEADEPGKWRRPRLPKWAGGKA